MAKQKITKPKVKSLFDHLKAITSIQSTSYWDTLSDGDKKTFSPYMVHRFLSMDVDLLQLVASLQQYTELLNPKEFYLCYINLIPRGNYYSKYIKGRLESKYNKELLALIKIHYTCSKYEATDYCEILYSTKCGREYVKSLCERYGWDPKEITKLKLKLK